MDRPVFFIFAVIVVFCSIAYTLKRPKSVFSMTYKGKKLYRAITSQKVHVTGLEWNGYDYAVKCVPPENDRELSFSFNQNEEYGQDILRHIKANKTISVIKYSTTSSDVFLINKAMLLNDDIKFEGDGSNSPGEIKKIMEAQRTTNLVQVGLYILHGLSILLLWESLFMSIILGVLSAYLSYSFIPFADCNKEFVSCIIDIDKIKAQKGASALPSNNGQSLEFLSEIGKQLFNVDMDIEVKTVQEKEYIDGISDIDITPDETDIPIDLDDSFLSTPNTTSQQEYAVSVVMHRVCKECGCIVDEDDLFCSSCGSKLEGNDSFITPGKKKSRKKKTEDFETLTMESFIDTNKTSSEEEISAAAAENVVNSSSSISTSEEGKMEAFSLDGEAMATDNIISTAKTEDPPEPKPKKRTRKSKKEASDVSSLLSSLSEEAD